MASEDGTGTAPEDDRIERLASFWRLLAEAEFRGYSPIYERIGTAFSDDAELLARLASVTDEQKVEPVLCLAATKYVAAGEPDGALARVYERADPDDDPWPAFRELFLDRFDAVAHLMRTRTIQTNEVGRAAVIVPALAAAFDPAVHRGIRLVEIGPSAGLNLALDRFHLDYGDGRSCGPEASPVRLRCDRIGPTPLMPPSACPPIPDRLGIDLSPRDVTDDDHVRWLEACIWPGVPDRLERFRAAVEVARRSPPLIRAGDAATLLPEVLAETPPDLLAVVLSTWVLAYFPAADRTRVERALAAFGADRGPVPSVAALTCEYPGIVPWIDDAPRPAAIDDPRGASLVGLRTWSSAGSTGGPWAWAQAHGRWLDALDPEW